MEIRGVPVHLLVVHAAVVFGPLSATAALAYVGVPKWRDWLRWPMVVSVVMACGAIVAAYLSGKNFLGNNPGLENSEVQTHADWGQRALWVTIGFAIIAVAACYYHNRTGPARTALNVALGVSALGTLVVVVLTGDAGARAVWG
jgi:Predicted membrane protein (DUF2231)